MGGSHNGRLVVSRDRLALLVELRRSVWVQLFQSDREQLQRKRLEDEKLAAQYADQMQIAKDWLHKLEPNAASNYEKLETSSLKTLTQIDGYRS